MVNTLLVAPRFPPSYWGFQYALELLGKRSAMPPLGLITVAAMLPADHRPRVVDMNVEELTDEDLEWADLVLTSTMMVQRRSLAEVVARCNRCRVPVVVGGPYPTSYASEIPGADHYVLGEVEEILPRFLEDWEAGRARRTYRPERAPPVTLTPVPRYDLLDLDAYSSMALQFSRGCPFDCEFCDITKLFGRVPRTKTADQVLAELDALHRLGWRGAVFLVDDNFIGNKREALRLLPAVARWQRERDRPFDLFTEASVNLARLEPLMDGMVDAGFTMVFLGIESPSPEALRRTRKMQNVGRGDGDYLLDAVRTIQRKGIEVSGGFILGLDGDGPEVFDAQVDFVQRAGIPMAMVGLLTAVRGTDLHARLEREGRLLDRSSGNNVEVSLNFRPELDRELLVEGYRRVLGTLYDRGLGNYFARCRRLLANLGPRRLRRRIGRSELLAAVRSAGSHLLSPRGPAYAGFLLHCLLRRPRLLPEAIRLGVVGLHFRRFTAQSLAAHDFREGALTGYDRIERLAATAAGVTGASARRVRRQARRTVRRLRRLHRRLRPEFRHGLFPDLEWARRAIRGCVRRGAELDLLPRVGERLRALVAEGPAGDSGQGSGRTGWIELLSAAGYRISERRPIDPSALLAVAPMVEGRARLCLEQFFRELGVRVVEATEQAARLGADALERLEAAGGDRGGPVEALRTWSAGIDALVLPLGGEIEGARERAQLLVARARHSAPDLPDLLCLRFVPEPRRLRESLSELGRALGIEPARLSLAVERALALV